MPSLPLMLRPPVPVLVERYPSWFPKVLESINIRSRVPRQFMERLHSRLKDFSGPVAEETNPVEKLPNDEKYADSFERPLIAPEDNMNMD